MRTENHPDEIYQRQRGTCWVMPGVMLAIALMGLSFSNPFFAENKELASAGAKARIAVTASAG